MNPFLWLLVLCPFHMHVQITFGLQVHFKRVGVTIYLIINAHWDRNSLRACKYFEYVQSVFLFFSF